MNPPIQNRSPVGSTRALQCVASLLLWAAAGLPAWAAGVVSGSLAGTAHDAPFDAGQPPPSLGARVEAP